MEQRAKDRATQLRDRIRGNFDRAAAYYAQFESEESFFSRLTCELLVLGPPLDGGRVLDVGCGTGASLRALTEAVGARGQVIGLDVSLGMLREARRQLGPGAALVAADGCSYGALFRGGFDAVVYGAVLFMLPDARASLASARETLRPGGTVLVANLEGAWVGADNKPVPDALAERGYSPGRHALSPWPSVLAALEELFEKPLVRRLSVPLSPAAFRSFYGLEPMSAGLLPSLPYPDRRAAVEALASEWEAGGHRIDQVWNLASARRPD